MIPFGLNWKQFLFVGRPWYILCNAGIFLRLYSDSCQLRDFRYGVNLFNFYSLLLQAFPISNLFTCFFRRQDILSARFSDYEFFRRDILWQRVFLTARFSDSKIFCPRDFPNPTFSDHEKIRPEENVFRVFKVRENPYATK